MKNDLTLFDDENFGLFNPVLSDIFFSSNFKNRIMKTDIKEDEKNYSLEIEMPGIDKKDINIDLEDGYLIISAETKENKDEKDSKGNYVRRERSYGSFSRSYYIGKDIKENDITANLEHGILNITFPKQATKKLEHKKIEIK